MDSARERMRMNSAVYSSHSPSSRMARSWSMQKLKVMNRRWIFRTAMASCCDFSASFVLVLSERG